MPSLTPVSGSAQEVFDLLRRWDDGSSARPLVIETSGSTGRPKRVRITRRALRASERATSKRLGGQGQWLLNLPATYVAGVQVLFRSVRAGTTPVLLTGDLPAAVRAMDGPRRYLSLVPTQLRRYLHDPWDTWALGRFDAVLVGGAPLWPDVRREAEACGIRVVQTYGMAETCGGCVFDGVPLEGVGVKIDRDGQVLLTGPMLFDGYDGDLELTARTLQDGWLRTNDLGGFDEDGRLRIRGRVDTVVVSGGLNVPAEAVEAMLEAHPDVLTAVVVGVPDEEWGERVVAVVECYTDLALPDLRRLVVPRTWAPKQLVTTRRMPYLANGKVDRQAARALALAGAAEPAP